MSSTKQKKPYKIECLEGLNRLGKLSQKGKEFLKENQTEGKPLHIPTTGNTTIEEARRLLTISIMRKEYIKNIPKIIKIEA